MTAKEWLKEYEEQSNTKALDTMIIEAAKIIKEVKELESRISVIQADNSKYCELLAKADIEIKELRDKIKTETTGTDFLKGQVEAYQYCLNCRR